MTEQAISATEQESQDYPGTPDLDMGVDSDTEGAETGPDYQPLFGDEVVTESELMGEDVAREDTAGEYAATLDPETIQADQDDPGRQPSPLDVALENERQTNRQLQAQLQQLSAENESLKMPEPEDDKFKDFKVLSDAEYDELLEEDPDEASRYLYKFNRYQAHQEDVEKRQLLKHQAQTAEREIVNEGLAALEKVLPGITGDNKPGEVGTLIDFAAEHGMSPDILAAITDPRTAIVLPSGQKMVLGAGAAQIVKMVKSTHRAISSGKRPGRKGRTTTKISSAGAGLVVSEEDFAKMSEEEQTRLLGG